MKWSESHISLTFQFRWFFSIIAENPLWCCIFSLPDNDLADLAILWSNLADLGNLAFLTLLAILTLLADLADWNKNNFSGHAI